MKSQLGSSCKRQILGLFLAAGLLPLWGCSGNPAPTSASRDEPPRGFPASSSTADLYDLSRDEGRGHTLQKHVGRTDSQLAERLLREPNISAASTWTDRETAEQVVAEALRAERGRIESWVQRGERRTNLALHYDARGVIGRSLRRGENRPVDCTTAVIVLRADGRESFYVLTTYPEARE